MLMNGGIGQLQEPGATKTRRAAESTGTINRPAGMSRKRLPKGLTFSFCMLLTVAFDCAAATDKTEYHYSLVTFDGKKVPLSTVKGKGLFVVNLASQSIFKDQILHLEQHHKKYR